VDAHSPYALVDMAKQARGRRKQNRLAVNFIAIIQIENLLLAAKDLPPKREARRLLERCARFFDTVFTWNEKGRKRQSLVKQRHRVQPS